MTGNPRATVLVPTHDRTLCLELAVRSVLQQSLDDIEVIIIGDGLTQRARDTVDDLMAGDSRVRLLDRPKSLNHGEPYRHEAILEARSDAIFYLCDDDLFLRDHVADLLELLEEFNFVHALNGYMDTGGVIHFYPGDLLETEAIGWIVADDAMYNSVSLTGTAHSKSFYLECGEPWTTADGLFPDHQQWRKMLRNPSLRAATSSRMTALQFPTHTCGRDQWSEQRRALEIESWAVLLAGPEGQSLIDRKVMVSANRYMARMVWKQLEDRRKVLDRRRKWKVEWVLSVPMLRKPLLLIRRWVRSGRTRSSPTMSSLG